MGNSEEGKRVTGLYEREWKGSVGKGRYGRVRGVK